MSDAATLLWDARRAGKWIIEATHGLTETDYAGDERLRLAVERQLIILGEALAVLRRSAPEIAARLPDLAAAIALRNVLVHGYAKVRDAEA